MSHFKTHTTNHLVLSTISDVSIFTCYGHIDALKGMQIKTDLNRFYNPNTKRELYLSALPERKIIDQEWNFCFLWQWTGEIVSNKTVAATVVTSEIASANNLDYSFVDWKVYINLKG